jgi:N-acetylglucosaminyldiphosphoundecaprenol N-acetyl-beta-D-mannosaminyltransferase
MMMADANAPSRTPRADVEPPTVLLDGVRLHALTQAEAVAFVVERLRQGRGGWLTSVNLEDLRLRHADTDYAALCTPATLALADGAPLVWASRIQGTPLPERVGGSDLVGPLAHASALNGFSLFLLGGGPGVAPRAAAALCRAHPGLRLAGILSPPFGFESDLGERRRIVEAVVAAQPDLVYVGLGKPKQEWLIDELRPRLPTAWLLGVGISLSFLSGDVRRAPPWMQRAGLEWLHRLAQEPRRLAGRYLVRGIPYAARLLSRSLAARVRAAPSRSDPDEVRR